MSEEVMQLAREIADLKKTMRVLADDADRLLLSGRIKEDDVRKLLEKMAAVQV